MFLLLPLQLLFDESQGTALRCSCSTPPRACARANKVFSAMDPSETPGARASVDMCEVKLDLHASG
jgi:hypothetical protein